MISNSSGAPCIKWLLRLGRALWLGNIFDSKVTLLISGGELLGTASEIKTTLNFILYTVYNKRLDEYNKTHTFLSAIKLFSGKQSNVEYYNDMVLLICVVFRHEPRSFILIYKKKIYLQFLSASNVFFIKITVKIHLFV